MLYADRIDGGLASVRGDSGGPVYQNQTATSVYAVGMIQGGHKDYNAPCGLTRTSPGSAPGACSSRVTYTSINTILRGLPGYSLNTMP